MKAEEKYKKKREQIIKLIEEIRIQYETDDIYIEVNPASYEAKPAAEKILSKFGINKPTSLKD